MFKHKKIVTLLILTAMLLTLLPTAGFAETLASPDAAAGTVIEDAAPVENNTDSTTPEKDGSATDTDLPANEQPDTETPADNSDNESAEEGGTEADNQTTQNKEDAETDMEAAAEVPQVLAASETRELTIYHILTTDGEPLPDDDAFKKNDRYVYSYKMSALSYPVGYTFDIAQLTKNNISWQTPQPEWVLTKHTELSTMPAYNAAIKLYYKLNTGTDEVRYTTPGDNPFQIRIDGRSAFCLNERLANPAGYKNVPYYAPIAFSKWPDYTSDTETLLKNILLVGYPCDAFGLQAKYNLSNTSAEFYTQNAFWTAINQLDEKNLSGYDQEVFDLAKTLSSQNDPLVFSNLTLANDIKHLNFIEQEDGSFKTEPIVITGYHADYNGPIALDLPNTMAVYTESGQQLDPAQIPANTSVIFTSITNPTLKALSASYKYNTPKDIFYYKAYIKGFHTDNSDIISMAKGFQDLFAYDIDAHTITASFPVTVTTKAAPIEPADPVDPTPVVPDNNGGGSGGNDTPDTPSTPSEPAAPAETLLPDENTPLAPAPEIAPEGEAEVTLDEEPVPLAPAAPISDNPKTGHPTNGIFILQICLLLAAAALLLKDLRQYKKAQ